MPQQETYFDERIHLKHVRVIKTYDSKFARDCFEEMNGEAINFLIKSLDLETKYEIGDSSGASLAWDDVQEEAREDGNLLSFFVVTEESDGQSAALYVSPDWPSAEAFAKRRLSPNMNML